ncbi:MAG: TIM barrel protein [Planctomycetota bacterium]|nr:TIM barrel protein [Planctomycetota bacterium]
MTQPGIPNEYVLSTSCYGARLKTIEDQAFAAVAMGFRRLELGLLESPVKLNGFEDSRRETGISVRSIVSGCLDSRSINMSGTKLGSLDEDLRDMAINSVRRHIRLAQRYQCPVVIVRGLELEDKPLREEADRLAARIVREGSNDVTKELARDLVMCVQKKGQRQIEHLCRSLHLLMSEFPETKIAIEPGGGPVDLLHFQAVGWTLDDLEKKGLSYWHDTGGVHQGERVGLPTQGDWLQKYAPRMVGVHLQDSADTTVAMPPGTGEIDFKLVGNYLPKHAERVVEINSRHGRAEILASVGFLVGLGI